MIAQVEPKWLTIAKGELGQAEVAGDQDNPRILEYLKSIALPVSVTAHDEISWCAAFVNWCLISSGIQGTHSPAARSFMNWGVEVKVPILGTVVVLKRGTAWQGHVAFFIGMKPGGRVTLLGGNQKNSVCEETFPVDQVIGYRIPNKSK